MTTAQVLPRDLCRSLPFELRAAADGSNDGLTLDGYAAVFNQQTLIDSWEGTFYEEIQRGAFRKSIRETTPVLQFDHGRHPLIGSIPLGVINRLQEDEVGLDVGARLTDNWLIQPIRDAIAEQAINGMSFRFQVVRDEWRDTDGKLVKPEDLMQLLWSPGERGPLVRTLKEVRVSELGPVVFPAYAETSVDVRSRDDVEQARKDATSAYRAVVIDLASNTEDAPPNPGHPSDESRDAPPDSGHPSPSAESRKRRDRIRAGMTAHQGYVLALTERAS
jgi:HK97 family phage prohead protease